MTFAAAFAVFAIAAREGSAPPPRRQVRSATAAVTATLLAVLAAPAAFAHDPGQGEDAGTNALRLQGRITVPDRGRWFVCAETRRSGRTVETWLPITVGGGRAHVADADRYAYFPPQRSGSIVKLVSGVALYGAMLALLYATLRLIRPSREIPPRRAGSVAAT